MNSDPCGCYPARFMLRRNKRGQRMDIQTIGIVGAGQMGNGIAHVMALAGYDVLLNLSLIHI